MSPLGFPGEISTEASCKNWGAVSQAPRLLFLQSLLSQTWLRRQSCSSGKLWYHPEFPFLVSPFGSFKHLLTLPCPPSSWTACRIPWPLWSILLHTVAIGALKNAKQLVLHLPPPHTLAGSRVRTGLAKTAAHSQVGPASRSCEILFLERSTPTPLRLSSDSRTAEPW